MEETVKIALFVIILVIVFIISRRILAYKMINAYNSIMNELKGKDAYSPESAVELHSMKKYAIRIGLRDYRPRVLQQLIVGGIIGINDNGEYYIKKSRDE